jgi:hypothetical protein
MNELIQELAEQAMVSISYRLCPNTYREIEDPTGPLVRQEFSKDKFAELIVRECVTTLERHHPFTKDPEAYLYAISLIEYHFGVE